MKILIDIGHPAHVHYFKEVINLLKLSGHEVIVISREKEITFKLLESLNISYVSRGKGRDSLLGKFLYLFYGTYKVLYTGINNKIDLYLSFASPYNSLASFFYRKPNIIFDDTEHNHFNHKIYVPLSTLIFTPETFKKDFGSKHMRFKGTMDSAYLHPKYFKPKNVELNKGSDLLKKNIIMRFVSWNASHDINQKGFNEENIIKLIEYLSPFANIFISSEKKMNVDLEKYIINIRPEEMHHYMKKADLFIGESGSMATEASYLGTHSIVYNSASREFGVFEYFSDFHIFYIADDFNDVMAKSKYIITQENLSQEAERKSKKIVEDSICLTDFIFWLVQNSKHSFEKKEIVDFTFMKKNVYE